MRSRAAIGNHPIHPMLVPIPIGAFFLALVGDFLHATSGEPFWYRFSYVAIAIGIASAILSAVFGAVEYFGVRMSGRGRKVATWHALANVTVVVLYAVSFLLRRHGGALHTSRWPLAMGLAVVGFLLLGVSGWLGGQLSYEHKVGVIENADPEATEIGNRERRRPAHAS